jgi:hypothetical protein
MYNSGIVCLKILFRVSISITSNQMKKVFLHIMQRSGGTSCRRILKAEYTHTDRGEFAFVGLSDGHCKGIPLKCRFFYTINLHEKHTEAYEPERALPQ